MYKLQFANDNNKIRRKNMTKVIRFIKLLNYSTFRRTHSSFNNTEFIAYFQFCVFIFALV